MGYWRVIETVQNSINIYDGPRVYQQTFCSAPRGAGLLFVAYFCQYEVCNGGFRQFFWNSTGVLAPEAFEAFREIEQRQVASLIAEAISLFGSSYPRERNDRQEHMAELSSKTWDRLDEMFWGLIDSEVGGFEVAADRYANTLSLNLN